eukprot:6121723-Pleurochrysis_carterae.AAC.3
MVTAAAAAAPTACGVRILAPPRSGRMHMPACSLRGCARAHGLGARGRMHARASASLRADARVQTC